MNIKQGLVLFLRYPQIGQVKTRLAKDLGAELTLRLYECFIRDMTAKLEMLPYGLHLFVTPAGKMNDMADWLGKEFPFHAQEGADLGARMKNAFEKMFRLGFDRCVLTGSDFPDLPVTVFHDAFAKLEKAEAVIGPTADGGYYLIGFQRDHFRPAVFNGIRWGTETVFRETMTVLEQENVQTETLRRWWDVDDINDLKDFYRRNTIGDFKDSSSMRFISGISHKGMRYSS
ncbi:MAG: glycosyltransferase [bacterium]|nr:glycosyltransferase [bacterium]